MNSYTLTPKQIEAAERLKKRIAKEVEAELYNTPILKAKLDARKALAHYQTKRGVS